MATKRKPPARDSRGRFLRRVESVAPVIVESPTVIAIALDRVDPVLGLRREVLPPTVRAVPGIPALQREVRRARRPSLVPSMRLPRLARTALAFSGLVGPILAYGWWRGIL